MGTTIERKPSFGHRVTHPSTESIDGEWFAPFSGQDADMLPSKSRKSSAKGEHLLDNDRNACFAPRVFKIVSGCLHGHGTQKPVECMRRPIENNSSPGQAVYEPFSGSGPTIIAAEMTGRSCLAIEIDPAYVDVATKRWQDFTSQDATLETGASFADTATEREVEGTG